MNKIPRFFYSRDTVEVARDLLGKKLTRRINNKLISGIITETEAYKQIDDPASHAHCGITKRNKAMFGKIGIAYIYIIYGIHYCINVVARNNEYGHLAGAVLIRSLQPVDGVNIMKKNRNVDIVSNLTNGPGKITQALQIDIKQYGVDLTTSKHLYISNTKNNEYKLSCNQRVGIKKGLDKLWNFKLS
ncbi:MAG: DNA-3-methyladenine glycosylase [Thaumarchaeota archaeon]|nr:DNA-3-methyladenine glycosylase [Nitrososphaerota archaeon]